MGRCLASAAALLLSSCGSGGDAPEIRKVDNARVDNLLTMPRSGDFTHFAGTPATFAIRGRCLIASTEQGDRTPVFPVGESLEVTDTGIAHAREMLATFGEPTGLWGHQFADLEESTDLDVGACPRLLVTFRSIRLASPSQPITQRPPG